MPSHSLSRCGGRWAAGLALLLGTMLTATPARAQGGVPIAPFVGAQFEGFETQHTQEGGSHGPGGAPVLAGGLFQGTAMLTATSTPFLIQLHSSSHADCGSTHRTGSYQCGGFLCELSMVFSSEQAAFGGYFASDTIDPMVGATREWDIEFLDTLGMVIGGVRMVLHAPCGEYQWEGWTLPVGTRRIDFAPVSEFHTLLMDDLMVSPTLPLGDVYCIAVETSLTARGQCGATGSARVTDNALTLQASQLPPNTFGFFLASRSVGFVTQPGGSQGNLCLGGSIGRYVGPGQIMNSGAQGTFALPIDLTAIPQPTGAVAGVVGEGWRFQCWFRDVTTGGPPVPTSNFTGGLVVTLE